MRAIVTGGNGFIGSHIVDGLYQDGHDVAVMDIAPPLPSWDVPQSVVQARLDVATQQAQDFIEDYHPDVVFHLAAKASVPFSIENPVEDARTTLLGLIHVLEGARRAKTRKIVYSSSAAVYGNPSVSMPIQESVDKRPISPYGVSKASGEDYLRVFSSLYGLSYAALRYANVYGPRQGLSGEGGVVAIFSKAFVKEQPVHLFGDGLHTRDYIYVQDVVRANLLASEYVGDIVCNVSTGKQTSNQALIQTLVEVCNRQVPILHEPERSGDVRHSALDPSLAKDTIGFESGVSLLDGIFETYSWMKRMI